jgi:hypothetical protein
MANAIAQVLNEKPRHSGGASVYCFERALVLLALLGTLAGLLLAALLLLARLLLARLLATALLLARLARLAWLIALLLLTRLLVGILVLVLAHPVFLQMLLAFVARSVPSRLSGQQNNAP